jgi:rhodanese-related sulfurtransferase
MEELEDVREPLETNCVGFGYRLVIAILKNARRLVIIVFVSLLFGLGFNIYHPLGLPLTLSEVQRPGIPVWIWKRLRFVDAMEAYTTLQANREVILIDVRDRKDYEKSHPKGALSFPYRGFDRSFPEFSVRVPSDRVVLLLCYGTDCALSPRVGSRLVQRGYTNVAVIKKGFEAWEKADLPVEGSGKE